MTFVMPDLIPVLPEIWVLCMVSFILVVDLFLTDARRFITYGLTMLTLIGAAVLTLAGFDGHVHATFNNMVVVDPMASVLKFLVYVAVAVVMVYSRDYLKPRGLYRGEFFVLALFSMLGMMVMISASHFLTLYMGLELLSLSLYALVALQRDSALASEAAMKYFVLGALASGMLLYGMSMLYGATGSLEIARVAAVIQSGAADHTILTFGVVFIVAGLAFKLGAVPFHMWVPDVYQGAATPMTLFIGAAPKLAAFAFVVRLLVQALHGLTHDWQQMLMILAVLSVVLGNLTAIAQTNLKRMLAYSTISHMGFVLMGFMSGTTEGVSAAMFYVVVYVLMTLGSFGVILLLSRAGFEAENIADFKGLNQKNGWVAFLMLLIMFSMAGIPPTVGFYAKLSILQSVIGAGYLYVAIVAVLSSLIGAFYYLRIIKTMYFDEPADHEPISAQPDVRALLSLNGLAVLALGIVPAPLMAICSFAVGHSL